MISVIVPVYNAEAYVSRCLESILNQTYRDIRVVCVNDGSTDGTGAILEDFRRRDSGWRFLPVKIPDFPPPAMPGWNGRTGNT